MTVSSEEDQGPLTKEYMLTGNKFGAVAYLGVSYVETGSVSLSVGETVAVRGVVVASGVAREIGGTTRDAIYVMGLSSDAIGTEGATQGKSLQTLAKEARESS